MFETWNLNCSYLQIPTSLKHVTTQAMVFLQRAQPWAQLPKHKTEALQFVQHSAGHIKLQGWFSMGPPYVQHQLQKFWACCFPAYSHTHVVTLTVQGRITPGVTLSRSDRKTDLEMLFTQKGVKSTGDLVWEAFLKQCHCRLLQEKKLMTLAKPNPLQDMRNMHNLLVKGEKGSILAFLCKSDLTVRRGQTCPSLF